MKAIWNDTVIAESDETLIIENNHYFPPNSIHTEYFVDSDHTTTCPWKGLANYKSIKVDNQINENAAWYYSSPKDAAEAIKGYFAFWNGVKIIP